MARTTLAERLGFGTDERVAVVHVDDLGMCHAANVGGFAALRGGPATCGSIMVPCPWFREAADQGDPEAQVELGLMLAQGQGGSGSVQETRQTEVPLSRRPGETDPLPTRRQG